MPHLPRDDELKRLGDSNSLCSAGRPDASPDVGSPPGARLPLFTWLGVYDRRWLMGDVVAGLTVWAVLVPEALAYASIAGVSPVVGLYAAPGALLLYAAFGSSRHLVVGPMAATAALSAAAVGDLAAAGSDEFVQLTVTLGLTVAILAIIAGLLRLGFLASFISEPVLKGFIIGLALTIIVGQLPKLFGGREGRGQLLRAALAPARRARLDQRADVARWASLTRSRGGSERDRAGRAGSLVAVMLGIAAVQLFDLDQHGVAIVGEIESGLPSLGLPESGFSDYLDLAPAAVGLMLIAFAEGLGAAKTYAAKESTTRSIPIAS
jgi:sulfate permease, SulP family